MFSPRLATRLAQLHSLSPMLDDDALSAWPEHERNPLEMYDGIMKEIEGEIQANYPLELIPFLLGSFGVGEGYGVYGHMLHIVEAYPNPQELYPLIQQATRSPNPGTRKWFCDMLGRRRNKGDEPFLIERLGDEIPEVRSMALLGLRRVAQCYDMRHVLVSIKPLLQDYEQKVKKDAK